MTQLQKEKINKTQKKGKKGTWVEKGGREERASWNREMRSRVENEQVEEQGFSE